jgi:hypothetical protein
VRSRAWVRAPGGTDGHRLRSQRQREMPKAGELIIPVKMPE